MNGYLVKPCRALVAAILLRAIRDLDLKRGTTRQEQMYYRACARRFLMSAYAGYLAQELDISPDSLTNRVKAILERIR